MEKGSNIKDAKRPVNEVDLLGSDRDTQPIKLQKS